MNEVRLLARAKINISLDVVRKREDGYHDLSMIMQTVNLYDKVNIRVTKNSDITLETNLPFLPGDDRNLFYRIADYMKKQYGIKQGLHIDLYKMIPIAAGLAGGSSDGAATIKAMSKLFDMELSIDEMIQIGKKFGADIPYCLVEGTVLAEGIGDVMTLLPDFPQCFIVIVKPCVGMSTAAIFGKLKVNEIRNHPSNELLLKAIHQSDLPSIAGNLANVLEEVTIPECPEIAVIKDKLLECGALGSLMSGSGSAVYGIFDEIQLAEQAVSSMKKLDFVKFAYSTTIYNREKC